MKCYNMYVEGNGLEIDAIVAAHSKESALMVLALEAHIHGIELKDEHGELNGIFNDPEIDIKVAQIGKISYDAEVPKVITALVR